MERLMLRPSEAAQLVGVGRTTLYKLIKSLEIPSCRLGKSIRIPVPALQAWAQEKGVSLAVMTARSAHKHGERSGRQEASR